MPMTSSWPGKAVFAKSATTTKPVAMPTRIFSGAPIFRSSPMHRSTISSAGGDGAFRRVLERHGKPEISAAAVAVDAVEATAIGADGRGGLIVQSTLDGAEVLGIERAQELGRADDVVEKGRNLPSLARERASIHLASLDRQWHRNRRSPPLAIMPRRILVKIPLHRDCPETELSGPVAQADDAICSRPLPAGGKAGQPATDSAGRAGAIYAKLTIFSK